MYVPSEIIQLKQLIRRGEEKGIEIPQVLIYLPRIIHAKTGGQNVGIIIQEIKYFGVNTQGLEHVEIMEALIC